MKKLQKTKATCKQIEKELIAVSRPDKAEFLPGFFQAYKGGYGEGDRFIGVVVPDQRRIARQFCDLPLEEISKLLDSAWHECRLTALYILVSQFERAEKLAAKGEAASPTEKEIVDFYLDHLDGVNNWDLVDSSAHKILGKWILRNPKQRKKLKRLATSKSLWRQRVSVIATFPLIRDQQFAEILELAEKFLDHPHDLMQKAVGWMLREMGIQDPALLRAFLKEHVAVMPRTMLRYAIEKMSRAERTRWLNTK